MKKILFIPAAGVGSRLKEMTADRPKAMVGFKGIPLIEYVLTHAEKDGFTDAVINVHHYAEKIEEYIKLRKGSLNCIISDERELLMNTGGALTHAIKYLDSADYVMVHNVDVLSNIDWPKLCLDFENSGADAFMVLQQRETDRRLAVDPQSGRIWAWYNKKSGELKEASTEMIKELGLSFNVQDTYAYNGVHLIKTELIRQWCKIYGSSPFSVIDAYLNSAGSYKIMAYIPSEPFLWRDMGKVSAFETDFIY